MTSVPRFPRKAGRKPNPNEVWRKAAAAAKRTELEDRLASHIRTWGLPHPEREYRFHAVRGWRFDFAWPDFHLAIEVEGGTWSSGRHTRGAGFEHDAEKYAEAAKAGWMVVRFTAAQVKSAYAVRVIEDLLSKRRLV